MEVDEEEDYCEECPYCGDMNEVFGDIYICWNTECDVSEHPESA